MCTSNFFPNYTKKLTTISILWQTITLNEMSLSILNVKTCLNDFLKSQIAKKKTWKKIKKEVFNQDNKA